MDPGKTKNNVDIDGIRTHNFGMEKSLQIVFHGEL